MFKDNRIVSVLTLMNFEKIIYHSVRVLDFSNYKAFHIVIEWWGPGQILGSLGFEQRIGQHTQKRYWEGTFIKGEKKKVHTAE